MFKRISTIHEKFKTFIGKTKKEEENNHLAGSVGFVVALSRKFLVPPLQSFIGRFDDCGAYYKYKNQQIANSGFFGINKIDFLEIIIAIFREFVLNENGAIIFGFLKALEWLNGH